MKEIGRETVFNSVKHLKDNIGEKVTQLEPLNFLNLCYDKAKIL